MDPETGWERGCSRGDIRRCLISFRQSIMPEEKPGEGMKRATGILAAALILAGCATTLESNQAAEETAWELSYILEDRSGAIVAVVDFETTDVPGTLRKTFMEDLGTNLAMAFRETGSNNRVVTRDRVDAVFAEQSLSLEGLTDSDARQKVGSLLGADILVSGTIIWLEDDLYRASAQLIETETGALLGGSSWDFWFDTESGR